MILQELLRNIIFYKGIMKPLLQSWSEGLILEYTNQLYLLSRLRIVSSLNEAKMTVGIVGYEQQSLQISLENAIVESTGAHTISDFFSFPKRSRAQEDRLQKVSFSNNAIVMLRGNQVDENAVNMGKTSLQAQPLLVTLPKTASTETMSTTTGLLSKQLCSFLSRETHEKRENLGDFSLTHEETPLLVAFKEGGELA